MKRLKDLTETTTEAAQRESIYDGYAWDVDPKDVLKLLLENQAHVQIFELILKKCVAGGAIWLLATAALEKHRKTWSSET